MARTVPGWERLKPSIGESGKPGWRLVSIDDEQQVAVYRKTDGPWADATIYCEWRKRDERWRFFMLDSHDRPYGPTYDKHFSPGLDAFNDSVHEQGLPPLF